MRRICLLAGLIAVIGLTTGMTTDSRAATKEEMVKAANALDQAFLAAFNKGDAAAMSALYAKDAVSFTPGDMMLSGLPAIKKGMVDMFAAMPGCKLTLTEVHHIMAGDMVASWGLWSMTMPGEAGATMTMTGRYTDLKAMRDGKWVYVLDHASVPMPPMEDEHAGHDH